MRSSVGQVLLFSLAAASARAEDRALERVTFDEAVARALRSSPTLQVARADVQRARAVVQSVRSAALPTLVGSGIYTRLDADRVLQDRVILGANQISANLLLTVPVIAPSRWVAWKSASDLVDVARLDEADAKRQLALAAGRTFLTVIAQQRVVEANQLAVKTAEALYDFAHSRRVGGIGNRLDEVRAAQELATFRGALKTAEIQLVRAREALGVLLAADGPIGAIADDREPKPLDAAATAEGAAQRVDVRAALERRRLAARVARWTWTDFLPAVSATFQPFYQNPPSLVQPLTGWQAQVILTLPIYDGGARYAQKRERDAQRSSAVAQADGLLRQARADVRAAAEALRLATEGLEASREAARLTHEAQELATLAYRAGATTNLELIDAQRRAHDADTAAAVAEDAVRQARLELFAAAGRFP